MPLFRYTLRQLESFDAVAELRSFSGAANRLGLTVQAVSQQICELEVALGFKLFDRTTRRVSVNGAGREFLGLAQSVLHHARAADSGAADVRNRAAGIVRVGAPLVLAAAALPSVIRHFAGFRPEVVVRIRDMAVDALVAGVAEGNVDLAVGPDRSVGDQVSRHPLFESPWVLWCSPGHPLASSARVKWSALHKYLIVAAGRDHEMSVAGMLASVPDDLRVKPIDVVDNVSTALGIAAQGGAATLAPAYVGVLARPMGLVMRRVVEPETIRTICFYKPLLRQLSPAALGFAEHAAPRLADWGERMSKAAQRLNAL